MSMLNSGREAVLSDLPQHMKLPMALMMFCGLDSQDALRLPKSAIADGRINVRRDKTGVPVWMPLPQPVIIAIEEAKVNETNAITLCVNSRGQPWTVSGFRASWRTFKTQLKHNWKRTDEFRKD